MNVQKFDESTLKSEGAFYDATKGGENLITVKHDGNEYPVNHIKSANRQFPMNDIPELSMIVVNRENNPAYPFLNEEEMIVTEDGHEWRIKVESEVAHYKNLKAQHILLDLTDMEFNQLLKGFYTPRSLLTTILSGTGFTLDLNDTDLASVELSNFGRKNPWRCLKEACELLKAEFTVLPGRIIRVRKRLSADKGKQYRYGYNLKNVTKKTDSTDIVTHITVNYGEDYTNTATFISPTAGNYGRVYYGDIINDERITDYETARKRAESAFKDIDLSYELDIAQLGNDCELGETIHTIYEPLNDLSITTRLLKMQDEWDGEKFVLTDATVGNYVFKTANKILQDQIKDTEKSVTEKISETKEIIQREYRLELSESITDLDEKITREYTGLISFTARELRTEFTETITDTERNITTRYTSLISQTARELRTEFTETITDTERDITTRYTSLISQTARELRTEFKESIADTEKDITAKYTSSISQTARELRTNFEAEMKTVSDDLTRHKKSYSEFVQTAESFRQTVTESITDISGDLTRHKESYSQFVQTSEHFQQTVSQNITEINGNVSTISYNLSNVTQTASQIQSTVSSQSTEISNLGSRMWSAESSISQTAYEISSKVSYTDFTGSAIASRLTQDPYSISLIASQINLDGKVIVNGGITGHGNIEVTNDVAVGNALYFGGYKGSFDFIKASGYMEFHSLGDFNFTGGGKMYLDGKTVPTSRTSGLGFGYSSAANRLYVSIDGLDVGYIKLT